MTGSIALIGAGGKMGCRLTDNFLKETYQRRLRGGFATRAGEPASRGVEVCDASSACRPRTCDPGRARRRPGRVAADVVPAMKAGALLMTLDPAAPLDGQVPDARRHRLCHRASLPSIGLQLGADREGFRDFYGGVTAKQAIVCALMYGTEADYERGVEMATRDVCAGDARASCHARPDGDARTRAGRDLGADLHGSRQGGLRPSGRRRACPPTPCATSCSGICASRSRCSSARSTARFRTPPTRSASAPSPAVPRGLAEDFRTRRHPRTSSRHHHAITRSRTTGACAPGSAASRFGWAVAGQRRSTKWPCWRSPAARARRGPARRQSARACHERGPHRHLRAGGGRGPYRDRTWRARADRRAPRHIPRTVRPLGAALLRFVVTLGL